MLPPPLEVLENNPHFTDLYEHLTKHLLATDGSTLAKKQAHDLLEGELNEARLAPAREQILLQALEEVGEDDTNNLSLQVREAVSTIAVYLSASLEPGADALPQDTDDLISSQLEIFKSNLPAISTALSSHLTKLSSDLSQTLQKLSLTQPSLSTRTPSRRQPTPSLSQHIQTLTAQTKTTTTSTLPLTLSALLTSLTTLQTTHTTALSTHIRRLELSTHGTSSRHQSARAAYLAAVSRGIALKAQVLSLEREREIYNDAELCERLEAELAGLEREDRRLVKLERELEGVLGEYERVGGEVVVRHARGRGGNDDENGGEGVFRALGERYSEVEREIDEVKRDIEKLETRAWRGR